MNQEDFKDSDLTIGDLSGLGDELMPDNDEIHDHMNDRKKLSERLQTDPKFDACYKRAEREYCNKGVKDDAEYEDSISETDPTLQEAYDLVNRIHNRTGTSDVSPEPEYEPETEYEPEISFDEIPSKQNKIIYIKQMGGIINLTLNFN